MKEEDILVLEANGYMYWGGALVDSKGKYLPSLELNGKTYTSETDETTFKIDWQNNKNSLNLEELGSLKVIDNKTISNSNNFYVEKKQIINDYNHFYNYSIVLIISVVLYLIIKRISK